MMLGLAKIYIFYESHEFFLLNIKRNIDRERLYIAFYKILIFDLFD